MKKKKFSFLSLDDDDYIESVSSKNNLLNNDEIEFAIAKEEALKIEKDFQKKIVEKKLREEIDRIKKSEKEAKKINFEYELKNKKIKNLKLQDLKLKDIQERAVKLKSDYLKEKEINKNENVFFEKNFSEIQKIFPKNEKLEIKTNIYLKKEIYEKICHIYKETGKSRSAIINKLIEIAIEKYTF